MRDLPDPDEPHEPHDLYAQRWRRLEDAILRSSGTLDAGVREALTAGREIPGPLALYVDKVTRHAYRVTDDDVLALLAAGYSQDQIFEATLSVALGAAQRRLRAGLEALRTARPGSATSETGAAQATGAAGEDKDKEKEKE
jgi:hypothetical protein